MVRVKTAEETRTRVIRCCGELKHGALAFVDKETELERSNGHI